MPPLGFKMAELENWESQLFNSAAINHTRTTVGVQTMLVLTYVPSRSDPRKFLRLRRLNPTRFRKANNQHKMNMLMMRLQTYMLRL